MAAAASPPLDDDEDEAEFFFPGPLLAARGVPPLVAPPSLASATPTRQGIDTLAPTFVQTKKRPLSSCCIPPAAAVAEGAVVSELLALIRWDEFKTPAKLPRPRGPGSLTRVKHVNTEQERRNELKSAINELQQLLPHAGLPTPPPPPPSTTTASTRVTQVQTIQTAVEYLRRVQQVSVALLEENKLLMSALKQQDELVAATSSSTTVASKSSLPSASDASRLFVVFCFSVWLFSGWFTNAAGSNNVHLSGTTTRQVLSSSPSDTAPPDPQAQSSAMFALVFVSSAARFVLNLGMVFSVSIFLWIATIVQDMPRAKNDQLRHAKQLIELAENNIHAAPPNWTVATRARIEAMELLRKPLRLCSTFSASIFLGTQCLRFLLHRLCIGLWLEHMIVFVLNSEECLRLELRALLLCGDGPYKSPQQKLHDCACLISAINTLAVLAPSKDDDSLSVSTMEKVSSAIDALGPDSKLLRLLLEVARTSMSISTSPGDNFFSTWSAMRVLVEPLRDGQIAQVILAVNRLLPSLKGTTLGMLLAFTGMLFFSMRRYEEAFLVHASVLRLTRACHLPPPALTFLACSIVSALVHLGKIAEANQVMTDLNDTFDTGLPHLPEEHLTFMAARIHCLAPNDYAAIAESSSKLLALVEKHSNDMVLPVFHLPFLLELVVERLLFAIEAADARLDIYVVGHREEMMTIVDRMLELISKRTFKYWAVLVGPMLLRLKAWQAHLKSNSIDSAYYFKKSILDAEHAQVLHLQVAYTMQVMERLST